MTKREAMRINQQESTLLSLGFTTAEAEALRRISMTLHRWSEHECNGNIERDGENGDGVPYWSNPNTGRHMLYRIPDRERGALKRLAAIVSARNSRVRVDNATGDVAPKAVTLPERAEIDRQYADRVIRTKDDYFSACKRIALRDDLRFLIRVAGRDMSPELHAEASTLLAQLEVRAGKPADAKAINALRDRYRMARYSWSTSRNVSEIGAVA